MPKVPDGQSFFSDQFSQHPQSVAERLRQRELRAIFRKLRSPAPEEDAGPDWLDLTANSTAEEIAAAAKHTFHESPPPRGAARLLRAERRIPSCPIVEDWKRGDIFVGRDDDYRSVPAEDQERSDAARGVLPLAHHGRLKLAWCAAADSAVDRQGADHIHTETTVDGHCVHIDRLERRLHSPGRGWTDVRIFVDNVLAGRAGSAGCSLGAGGSDLPAVARVGRSKVMTVDIIESIAVPIVELWECAP